MYRNGIDLTCGLGETGKRVPREVKLTFQWRDAGGLQRDRFSVRYTEHERDGTAGNHDADCIFLRGIERFNPDEREHHRRLDHRWLP